MKYLKTFEANWSNVIWSDDSAIFLSKEIVNELHDICQELKDEGYKIEIDPFSNKMTIQYRGSKNRDFITLLFLCDEVVERIRDYMSGIGCSIRATNLPGGYTINFKKH